MGNSSNASTCFPALTPGQRLFLEVNGYVVLEKVLSNAEVARMLAALQKLKREFISTGNPEGRRIRRCLVESYSPRRMVLQHVLEADPEMLEYLTHPRIVAMVEETVGGKVRLEESGAIINRRDSGCFHYAFHRGAHPRISSYVHDGLYHCMYVKALTNLTDLGPNDGGTAVIVGSHKLCSSEDDIVAAAYENPSMIHQVVAPAGSTLLFFETLIHATGPVRSARERTILIGGYSHPKFQTHMLGGEGPSPQFVQQVPERLRELLTGSPYWTWQERHRSLGMPANMPGVSYEARMWSANPGRAKTGPPSADG